MINDKFEMKSIDNLIYKFSAGLPHDQWHQPNFGNDAAKGFELFIGCKFEVHQKPETMYQFWSQ